MMAEALVALLGGELLVADGLARIAAGGGADAHDASEEPIRSAVGRVGQRGA